MDGWKSTAISTDFIQQLIEEHEKEIAQLRNEHAADLERTRFDLAQSRKEEVEQQRAEIYEAWRFSSQELSNEADNLRGELESAKCIIDRQNRLIQRLIDDLCVSLEQEERSSRRKIVVEEELFSPLVLRKRFLGRFIGNFDTRHAGKGLYEMFHHLQQKIVTGEVEELLTTLLSFETQLIRLSFNTTESEGRYSDAFDVPTEEIVAFLRGIVCSLPSLVQLNLYCLPSFRECVLPHSKMLPKSLEVLYVFYTPFTATDLEVFSNNCVQLKQLYVQHNHCRDWGQYDYLRSDSERQTALKANCRGIIVWCL